MPNKGPSAAKLATPQPDMKKAACVNAPHVGIFTLKSREFPHGTPHLQFISILLSHMSFFFPKIESHTSKAPN